MDEDYAPSSDFLVMVANGEVPLSGSPLAEQNLRLLIAFTRDPDLSNRDWATMLLAQQEFDTPSIRDALLIAASDEDACVRGEALQGIAERDRDLALPLLQRELQGKDCGYATFQAATDLASPALIEGLRRWEGRGGASWIDSEIRDAIAACLAAQNSGG